MLWYSLEAPCWGTSDEYSQHMFSWRNKKITNTVGLKKTSYQEIRFYLILPLKPKLCHLTQIVSLRHTCTVMEFVVFYSYKFCDTECFCLDKVLFFFFFFFLSFVLLKSVHKMFLWRNHRGLAYIFFFYLFFYVFWWYGGVINVNNSLGYILPKNIYPHPLILISLLSWTT